LAVTFSVFFWWHFVAKESLQLLKAEHYRLLRVQYDQSQEKKFPAQKGYFLWTQPPSLSKKPLQIKKIHGLK
jgi:hypothetical protein